MGSGRACLDLVCSFLLPGLARRTPRRCLQGAACGPTELTGSRRPGRWLFWASVPCVVLAYGVTYIWQESGTTFSTLSRAVFALMIEKTGNVWAQDVECYNKDMDRIRLWCSWNALGLGRAVAECGGDCLWLGAAVSAYCSEPQNTVTSIHALLRKAENEPGGIWSLRHFSYLPLASVKQEKTSEGCFETYALSSLWSNASFLFSLALLPFKHQSIQLSLFFISAVKEVFLATWIVWHFFLYKSYKWVKKQPVYFPHFTFLFF